MLIYGFDTVWEWLFGVSGGLAWKKETNKILMCVFNTEIQQAITALTHIKITMAIHIEIKTETEAVSK